MDHIEQIETEYHARKEMEKVAKVSQFLFAPFFSCEFTKNSIAASGEKTANGGGAKVWRPADDADEKATPPFGIGSSDAHFEGINLEMYVSHAI